MSLPSFVYIVLNLNFKVIWFFIKIIIKIMKCFLSQSAALNSENTNDHFSKVVEVFSNYIRAPQRKAINLITVSDADR